MSQSIFTLDADWQTSYLEGRTVKAERTLIPGVNAAEEEQPLLAETCAELEFLFVYELLKVMRSTVPKTDLLGGGGMEEQYTAMMDMELARHLALRGDLGIGELLLGQMDDQRLSAGNKENLENNGKVFSLSADKPLRTF
ncbi:hypothetical protein TRIP_B200642 [uncultured Desulfatiglans sp.]|uniref:Flagellar protein FlgJ N-terminal domain-containing protein n=1 Tax=Uncultured Desulfatiglans sp. TaxID=1748965 RepID=A0A653A4B6_UNCDX|nr:hypothetical protein TRIP_B200642 [uncultured Desulfatiglans sp.]